MRKRIQIIKLDNPCRICGHSSVAGIDFHHLDGEDKDHTISRFKSWTTTLNEIQKCVSLCATHHRLIHSGELEYNFDNKDQLLIREFGPFPSFKF